MNTSKKTQLALVYIRYSSHAQDNGNSPAAQMTCAENYTEAHQMTIEQIYHDYAKTGRNTNREGYQQMKNDILSGKVRCGKSTGPAPQKHRESDRRPEMDGSTWDPADRCE